MKAAMTGETARWVSYDEAASLLGLSADATKRVVLRRGWPRRNDAATGTQVAVPDPLPVEDADEGEDGTDPRQEARTLLAYLELRVEQLTEELSEARMEMRGVRFEAESLRIDAARAQVFSALVEAERARSTEIKAERDRLAEEVALGRRSWVRRLIETLTVPPRARRRPF